MESIETPVVKEDWVGSALQLGGNVIDSLGKLFGFDLTKYVKSKTGEPDYNSMMNQISKAFSKLEIKDTAELNKLQEKLESLIGQANFSPNLKKVIIKAKQGLSDKMNEVRKRMANTELRKTQAQGLASAIDSATAGDYATNDYKEKKARLEKIINNPSGTEGSVEQKVGGFDYYETK